MGSARSQGFLCVAALGQPATGQRPIVVAKMVGTAAQVFDSLQMPEKQPVASRYCPFQLKALGLQLAPK